MNYRFDQLAGTFAHRKQITFKTSALFVLPESAASPWVEYFLVGGGGSGARSPNDVGQASGGDGGEVVRGIVKILEPTMVIIGAGGVLVGNTSASGVAGSDSTFGDIIARGGLGGSTSFMFRAQRLGRRGGLGGFGVYAASPGFLSGVMPRNVDGGKGVDGFGGGGGAVSQIYNSSLQVYFGSGADGGGDGSNSSTLGVCDAAPNSGGGGGGKCGSSGNAGRGGDGYGVITYWDYLP